MLIEPIIRISGHPVRVVLTPDRLSYWAARGEIAIERHRLQSHRWASALERQVEAVIRALDVLGGEVVHADKGADPEITEERRPQSAPPTARAVEQRTLPGLSMPCPKGRR